jgi:hypothetical protein
LLFLCLSFTLAPNGFGLAEGGGFERLKFKFTIMLNRIPNAQNFVLALKPRFWQYRVPVAQLKYTSIKLIRQSV